MQRRSPLTALSFCVGFVLTLLVSLISFAAAQACVSPPAGLTGWWPGDGSTEDRIGDRNAVFKDDATFGPGLVDQAFILDGDGDFVDVPHEPALNVGTGDFTVDLWVFFDTTEGQQVLVEKYVEDFSPTPPGWFLTKLEDNSLRFGTGPGSLAVNSPPLTLPANTWIHFAARRRSGDAAIFVNGMEVATGPLAYNADSTSSLKFGHRGSPDDTPGSTDTRGFFLNGRIDEVELFVGHALSAAEIAAIFTAGSTGKCKDLQPCTLSLRANATDGTLSLEFALGTQEPATWNVWLTAQTEIARLLSIPLSVLDPPVHVPFTIPFIPPLGTVGVLTTLVTPDQGIICSDFETVETGLSAEGAASSMHALQDVLQRLVK
jgi:hypothetical protein